VHRRIGSAAFVILTAVAILGLGVRAAVTVRDAETSDFRCFYEAARVSRLGLDPYDRAVWAAATMSDPEHLPPCDPTFIYPLWTAEALVPMSLLRLPVAVALWEIIELLCVVFGVVFVARAWARPALAQPLLVAVLWSLPMFSAVANAQFGPLLLFATAALGLAIQTRRNIAGAIAWSLLLLKPHVAVLTLAGVIVSQRRRLFAALAVAVGLAVLVFSVAIARSWWPAEVIAEVSAQQRLGDEGLDTFWGIAASLDWPPALAVVLAIASCLLIAALSPRRRLDVRELLALLAPASLVVTPYARTHDQLVLAISWGGGFSPVPCSLKALDVARP
jgi:glycosyl transferase family 87